MELPTNRILIFRISGQVYTICETDINKPIKSKGPTSDQPPRTLLDIAFDENDFIAASQILEFSLNPNVDGNFGNKLRRVFFSHPNLVGKLLGAWRDSSPPPLNAGNQSFLHMCIFHGKEEWIARMGQMGVPLTHFVSQENDCDNVLEQGHSPLTFALFHGQALIAKYLWQQRARSPVPEMTGILRSFSPVASYLGNIYETSVFICDALLKLEVQPPAVKTVRPKPIRRR